MTQNPALVLEADALDRALQNDEEPTETYSTFSDCADLLFSCESALRDQWCEAKDFDEVEYQADQDKALKYRVRYSHLKNKVSTAKRNNEPDSHSIDFCFVNVSNQLNSNHQTISCFYSLFVNFVLNMKIFFEQFKAANRQSAKPVALRFVQSQACVRGLSVSPPVAKEEVL
ncbi:hypothetical protein ACJJTC_000379 [Scirpophaga incertulas]